MLPFGEFVCWCCRYCFGCCGLCGVVCTGLLLCLCLRASVCGLTFGCFWIGLGFADLAVLFKLLLITCLVCFGGLRVA